MDGYAYQFSRAVVYRGDPPDFDDSGISEIIDAFDAVRDEFGAELGRREGAAFESRLVEPVHRNIRLSDEAASDPGFWRWLAVRHFFQLTRYRHPPNTGGLSLANFGVYAITECLIWRLWYRADLVFDVEHSTDPYWLARLGDQEIWRSHLLRIRYGACRHLARELIRFQYPDPTNGLPRLKTADKNDGIRLLAKKLRRRQTAVVYEALGSTDVEKLLGELSRELSRAQ